jgi:hypothetical protein
MTLLMINKFSKLGSVLMIIFLIHQAFRMIIIIIQDLKMRIFKAYNRKSHLKDMSNLKEINDCGTLTEFLS